VNPRHATFFTLKFYTMPVNCKKITEKRVVDSHATPVLLLSVGHDHVSGQLTICITQDRTDQEIIAFLQGAINELKKQM
jgi:hypothetical protein